MRFGRKDAVPIKKWCTVLADRTKCIETCKTFGDKMCKAGNVLSYAHEDQCKRDAKECSCCCSPTCIKAPGLKWTFLNLISWHFVIIGTSLHWSFSTITRINANGMKKNVPVVVPQLASKLRVYNEYSYNFLITFWYYWHKFALVLFYLHEDQCKRDAKECSCCCSPTCIKAPGLQ